MEKEYRLIIAGGRDFNDYSYMQRCCMPVIDKLRNDYDVVVVSGHAQGADMLGERLANEQGVKLDVQQRPFTGSGAHPTQYPASPASQDETGVKQAASPPGSDGWGR